MTNEITLEDDIIQSRDCEKNSCLFSMKAMYESSIIQNSRIYDIAFVLTKGFSKITNVSILEDSRIIKILRYAVAPTISQMKFGQLFSLNSTSIFENDKVITGMAKYKELEKIAEKVAEFASKNIDRTRFIWLTDKELNSNLIYNYAKKWTCSIVADQNAQTTYRNWRKEQQEQTIITKLISLGYIKSNFLGTITKKTDINVGEFTKEVKVKGRTVQKADVVFRSKQSKKLVLIEAKSVGVELDATKRVKECCDKANDWRSSTELDSPNIVVVIAGFFTTKNIISLEASHICIIWEHRLNLEEKI